MCGRCVCREEFDGCVCVKEQCSVVGGCDNGDDVEGVWESAGKERHGKEDTPSSQDFSWQTRASPPHPHTQC